MGHVLYFHKKNLITYKVLLKVWHHSLNHKSWKNDAFIFYPITCITIYDKNCMHISLNQRKSIVKQITCVSFLYIYTWIQIIMRHKFLPKNIYRNYLCWAPIISFDSSLKISQTSQHFIGMRFLQINLWWARQVWKVYTYL